MANKAFGTLHQDAAYHLLVSAGKLDADVITSEQETFAFRRTILARLLPNVLENSSVDPHIVLDRVQRHVNVPGLSQKVVQDLTVVAHKAVEMMPDLKVLQDEKILPKQVQGLAQSILDYTNIGKHIQGDDPNLSRYLDNWTRRMHNLYLVSPTDGVGMIRMVAYGEIKAHPLVAKAATRMLEPCRIPITFEQDKAYAMAHLGHPTPRYH